MPKNERLIGAESQQAYDLRQASSKMLDISVKVPVFSKIEPGYKNPGLDKEHFVYKASPLSLFACDFTPIVFYRGFSQFELVDNSHLMKLDKSEQEYRGASIQ